jgi:hypothetical protein
MQLHLPDRLLHVGTAFMLVVKAAIDPGELIGQSCESRLPFAVIEFTAGTKFLPAETVDPTHGAVDRAQCRFHFGQQIQVVDD